MDLQSRKYNLVEDIFNIQKESVLETLELIIRKNKKQSNSIPESHLKELNHRMNSYKDNSDDLLDWEDVRNDW